MKILSMQATFGKLENETITFTPDLNVLHAPNEWGKSTWCGFIAAMLYGIDTRERTTQTTLADKERYAPWSGKPMTGRMELEYNGKHITIERSSKGRSIFGVFKAYETESGLTIPELTAENCGLVLLGVEKSVFLKSAFIRQSDLPVTQDEALRRRLNALVTTGDESGASDRLAQQLRDLKNSCRHNKTGLLPQAEEKRAKITAHLNRLQDLQTQAQQLTQQAAAAEDELRALENHRIALRYQAAQADLQQVEKAQAQLQRAQETEQTVTAACACLPTPEEANAALEQLAQLQAQYNDLQRQELPTPPAAPVQKAPFHGMDAQQAADMVTQDTRLYQSLRNNKQFTPYWIIGVLGIALGLILVFTLPHLQVLGWLTILAGQIPILCKYIPHLSDKKVLEQLAEKYGSADPAHWQRSADTHNRMMTDYNTAMAQYNDARNQQRQQRQQLEEKTMSITQGAPMDAARKYWEQVQSQHRALAEAKTAAARAAEHVNTLQAVVRIAEPPKETDHLNHTEEETVRRIASLRAQRQQLQQLLGQAQGQADTYGSEEQLQKELQVLDRRIEKLERTYAALILAQQTLEEAALELQRQFAPRISKRAGQLFEKLTQGRYQQLTLDQDLSLSTRSEEENTMHSWQWRSDGTIDQLYLALRLAVAEELIPNAPVILDDALIRFDDKRMAQAMNILAEIAIDRQIILFSCQKREKNWKNS